MKSGASENVIFNCDNWKVIVYEATGKKWSDFTITKSEMVERTCKHLNKLKSRGISIRYIQLDPAGENLKLSERAGRSNWAILQLMI